MIAQTPLETDLFAIERAASGTIYHGQRLAEALNAAHNALWSLPDARLAAALNHLGAAKLNDLMTAHGAIATAVNAALDNASVNGPRAIIEAGRDIEVASNGTITVIPPAASFEEAVGDLMP
jgi:hypothetical protein